MIAAIGRATIAVVVDVGGMTLLVVDALRGLVALRVDLRETLRHLHRFAVQPFPIVFAGSLVTGGVVAMNGLQYIQRYGASEVYGWAAGVSSFRDVGPLLLGFTLASRLGGKNTAELSSMAARERLDALVALGLDVRRVVVLPRLVAIALAGVVLYPLATTTVLLSSFAIATFVGDQSYAVSWWSFVEYTDASIVREGMLRLVVFAAWIGVASSWFGRTPGVDAATIGRAVYASSVTSLGGIVVLNLFLSFLQGTT